MKNKKGLRKISNFNKGITLIALIITIIVLLILAGVILIMVVGDNGILHKASTSKEKTNETQAIEDISLIILEVKAENKGKATLKQIYDKLQTKPDEYKVTIESEIASISDGSIEVNDITDETNGIYVTNKKYGYEIEIKKDMSVTSIGNVFNNSTDDNENSIMGLNDSLLGKISELTTEGVHEITITGNNNEIKTYNIHLIILNGNQTIEENTTYGDANDIGTASTYAKNMVVVKVKGDLTINEGVTVSPYYSSYGGPKGFMIFVSGTLTNNGTIDNSHGAKAVGENVYLWKNADDSYEYIPSAGGAGGASVNTTGNSAGNSGEVGQDRQTGGGASGGCYAYDIGSSYGYTRDPTISGAGSAGTSYSGGTGGGASVGHNSWGFAHTVEAASGFANGGAGGNSASNISTYTNTFKGPGGGTGNPGGNGAGPNNLGKGLNGTGGLLIIYAKKIINNSVISANGSNSKTGGVAMGGASGGGSVNIFYKKSVTKGTITANGGEKPSGYGSAGGNGTITIGKISTGTFVKDQ